MPLPVRPARPASRQVCVVECGARCCRTRGHGIFLDDDEQQLLARLAGIRTITFREVAERRDPRHRAGWLLAFNEQPGGHCPFLDVSSNLCGVYASRPEACRRFPNAPTTGCLLWPKEEPS
jgi:Fe-S-cluster containining protein